MTDAARQAGRDPPARDGEHPEGGPPEPDPAAPPADRGDGRSRARARPGTSRCPYCREDVAPDGAFRCAACSAPHHPACWVEHGACAACRATAAEHGASAEPATYGREAGPAPRALAPELARELAPDEVLCWHGAPAPEAWRARLNRGLFLALAAVAAAGVLFVGLAAGVDGVALAALMAAELALALRAVLRGRRRRARLATTRYALTDRRVLVLEGPPGRRVGRARPLARLADVQLERAPGQGPGTITFVFAAAPGDPPDEPLAFEELADLDEVLALAHAAHARARRTGP